VHRRIGVHAELLAQRLGVQTPAFVERGLAGESPEPRQLLELALQRDLEVVARGGLVQVQRLERPARARLQVERVDVEDAEAGAVLRWSLVRAARRRRGAERLDRADLEVGPGPDAEQPGQERLDGAAEAAVGLEQLVLALEVHRRVALERREVLLELA